MPRAAFATTVLAVALLGGCGTGPSPEPTASASVVAASSTPSEPTPAPSPLTDPTPSPTPPDQPAPPTATPTSVPAPAPPTPEPCIPMELRGKDVTTVSTDKVIALTFDGGSANQSVGRILDTLQRTGTPATFFLTGDFVTRFPADAKAIAAAHPVGNHSQTHPHFTKLTEAQVRAELNSARTAILEATGQDPRPYFRFPYGDVDATAIERVNTDCYVPFRWTTDSLGWKGTSGGMSADGVRQRVVSGAKAGGIILMHVGANPDDGTQLDADALPGIISDLTAAGYRFVTLEALLPATP